MSDDRRLRARHDELPRSLEVRHPRRLLLHGLRPFVRVYTRRRFGVTVHGADRVPASGPVILAANHLGWLDGPLLAVHSPRPVHALTKREIFTGRMERFMLGAGQIPIDRFAPDPAAIKTCLRVLRDGGTMAIFPEGARGPGEFELFQRGAAYLALITGAPVIPVIFFGTRERGADSHSRPSRQAPPVDIVFGEPWRRPASPWPRRKADVAAATESLREHLLEVLKDALTLTGRELPGPLPRDDSERDVAAKQAAQ